MRNHRLLLFSCLLGASLHAVFGNSPTVDEKKFRITPLAGPGYTPEMGFVIGGGILMSWYPGDDPSSVSRSTMPLMFTWATAGGISATAKPQTFWFDDFLRLDFTLEAKSMPDNYWGVGYDAGRSYEKGPDTAYRQRMWAIDPNIRFRVIPNLYVGTLWDVGLTIAEEVNPNMESNPEFIDSGSTIYHSGFGFSVQYDTRDFPQNAWKGLLLESKATFYFEALGSSQTYQNLKLDYRQYQTLWRKGAVLAWQIAAEEAWGDIPWSAYPQIGSPFDLRGYYRGRFRDEAVIWGITEYRHTFLKKTGELSKFGFVAWVGVGALGNSLVTLDGALFNTGLGFRFEVQPRLNVRMDLGYAPPKTVGFYFNFQEAF